MNVISELRMFPERLANGRSMVDAIRTSGPFQELH